jgi:ATP-dependent DNA helicase 2 subunit 2
MEEDPDTSIEIAVKTTKGTAMVKPPSMKKFQKRPPPVDEDGVPIPLKQGEEEEDIYGLLRSRSEYVSTKKLQAIQDKLEDAKEEYGDKVPAELLAAIEAEKKKLDTLEKETLTRSYKYGATWVDVEDEFQRLETEQCIDICAFFPVENVRITIVATKN